MEPVDGQTSDGANSGISFFDFVRDSGLDFGTESIEDFLLSLKAKQFMILSGGTGTGKTHLAKTYGEFLSGRDAKSIDLSITIGKGVDNNGFTLSRDQFFGSFPPSANPLDGTYAFTVGGVEGRAKINITPRFWFDRDDPNRDKVMQRMRDLKSYGDKAVISLKLPSMDPGSKNYLIVPVGSNWTDSRHVLGYRNAITNTYSGTPALDMIVKSGKKVSQPFILIFDEMNLSHVERYLSDVISAMESREPIDLDTSPEDSIPRSVSLGDNLFIIGTVNMDETTHMFSPKVLDRANVLEFDPVPISDYFSSDAEKRRPSGDVEFLQDCLRGLECRYRNSKDLLTEIVSDGNSGFKDSIVSDLGRIQGLMSAMKLSFGFRTLDEVMRFMYVAWIYEGRGTFGNWKRYFDSQIRQKILPKIHGNSSISVPLKEFGVFCSENGYPKSAVKLERMISVLESQRYVSFNC